MQRLSQRFFTRQSFSYEAGTVGTAGGASDAPSRHSMTFISPRHSTAFASPRSSGAFSESSSTPSVRRKRTLIFNRENKRLEVALGKREYVLQLLQILPDTRSECMLRLAWALLDLRQVAPGDKKHRALVSQMNVNFLQPDSHLEVTGLPAHLAVLRPGNAEELLTFLLTELNKLPAVLATVDPDSFEESMEAHSWDVLLSDGERLGEVIKDKALKNALLQELMSHSLGAGLLVKIRFVAAVDQYLACADKQERKDLERMVRKIFLTKGGMFYMGDVATSPTSSSSSSGKLEMYREAVLRELGTNQDVLSALRAL